MSLSRNIIKFNTHTSARDKFYRTFQYGARLIAWYLDTGKDDPLITRLRRVEAALSLSRKLFRLGNTVDLAYKTIDCFSIDDYRLMILSVTGTLFKSVWLFLDHCLWFSKIGVLQIDQPMWSKWALRVWLVALVASTAADIKKLKIIKAKLEKEIRLKRRVEGEKISPEIQTELHNVQTNFYKDFCDMFIPLSGLNVFNPGVGALCGVISSLVGFQQEWEKHITPYTPTL
ncbi:peroxisomal membrane protein 11A-like [Haliotis rubra]|uniref:peroxisomal membrane protein 11A-like n=1 Tax=Haliotis rubra TaxID=36100 RepID=UPI001EE5DCD3|nr:peroxisomal membrane protein 11A-like [Haliotis rubra]